jgi:hypothetical protein
MGMDAREVLLRSWAEATAALVALDEDAPERPDPTPEVVAYKASLAEYQAKAAALQQQIFDCEHHLKDLCNRHGEVIDEQSGYRAYVKKVFQWVYDADAWLTLAKPGTNARRALEDALDIKLTGKAVTRALKDGLVSEMELDAGQVRKQEVKSRTLEIVKIGEGGQVGR